MRNGTKSGMIFTIVVLLISLSFALPTFAKSNGKTKTAKSVLGYCYYNGKIAHITEKACARHRGTFFKDKMEAEAYKDAQTPGYCCLNNKVIELKKGNCKKKKGHFFKKKDDATRYCEENTPGWCCEKDKVVRTTRKRCKEVSGRFFKEKKASLSWRELHQKGFCLLDGKILATTKGDCEKKKGQFFRKKAEAQRAVQRKTKAAKKKTRLRPYPLPRAGCTPSRL